MTPSVIEHLSIGGLEPFSSCDWPGKLSCVIFLAGCPWRCSYCHNPHLWTRTQTGLNWQQIEHFLQQRQGLLDGVVFSGGEPLVEPALPALVQRCKTLGFQVGLHTGGAYPQRLQALIPLLDWVGLDIKTEFSDYAQITRRQHSGRAAHQSLELLLASALPFECRTSIHPDWQTESQLVSLAQTLASLGVKEYHWQHLRLASAPHTANWPSDALQKQISRQFSCFSYR